MTTPHATLTQSDGVVTVTFDRQDKLNAVSPAMRDLLWDGVRALQEDESARVLVIRALGRYFTAGLELESFVTHYRPPSEYRSHYAAMHELYDAMERVDKPIVLAAQGTCIGFGVEMAGSVDFRLASESARFGLPEITLAVIPGSGGTSRITRLLGPQWAKWLAMAGQQLDAQRALSIGLVHDVYPDEGFHDRVHEFALGLVALPREALGLAKIAINMCANTDPATARDVERLVNNILVDGTEYKERVQAFLDRGSARRTQ